MVLSVQVGTMYGTTVRYYGTDYQGGADTVSDSAPRALPLPCATSQFTLFHTARGNERSPGGDRHVAPLINIANMEGWLYKSGARLGAYSERKRYFVLDPEQKLLRFYQTDAKKEPRGVIELPAATSVELTG